MFEVFGQKCPVCNEKFKDSDDVVFCPECGTPHHRECYLKNGACINADKHKDGFSFKVDKAPVFTAEQAEEMRNAVKMADMAENVAQELHKSENATANPTAEKAVTNTMCNICGAQNKPDALFCESCGAPIGKAKPPINPMGMGGFSPMGDTVIPEGSFITPEEKIDDIPAKDWALYIGNAAPYYLFNFKKQDSPTDRGLSFTPTALIFPALYFLYRRVWPVAIIVGILTYILGLPSSLVLLQELEVIKLGLTATQMATFSNVAYICSIVSMVVSVLCGFFAVKLFRKSAGKKLKKIKAKSANDTEYYNQLRKLSGPSKILYVVIGGMFLLQILMVFVGI